MSERIPFAATPGAGKYDALRPLPVAVLLENVRSLYNVGSFFRTCDAAAVRKLILCGYTAYPPHKRIAKTALGAEEVVAWEHHRDPAARVRDLRQARYEIAVVETSLRSVDLFDWVPAFPVCVVFGNEVTGVTPALLEMCDTHVRIPMLGRKHSLNVATAGGVVIYELVRKYRRMLESVP